jgi:excisionase family DNA binding protein
MEDIFLTVTEAAQILKRSGESVRNYERRGILPASKTARGIRLFRRSDVEALAEKQQKEPLGFQPRIQQQKRQGQ